ncbi:MAG: ZIP family metal transporter [Methanomassiliicoccaceae archaeon]|jgi:zinc transporter 9|nr:ZIP family metal transporter [Methanomassiliicoccaceae archaeon]
MFEDMGPYIVLLIFASAILAVSLAGAYIPTMRKMDPRQVHLMVALSAGIFLGILFFMLLPEAFDEANRGMDVVPWIVGGFLVVLFVDALLKRMHLNACPCEGCVDHGHELTSISAFVGLAIHAAVDGVVLSVALSAGEDIGLMALIGISLHKFVELFALSSTFKLTGIENRTVYYYMILFALITPIAAFVSMPIINVFDGMSISVPLAIAAGTFMYVGIYALLPEAFHDRRDSIRSFVLVVAGIAIIALLSLFLLGDHGH